MSAYNKVNGTHCSENKKLLKDVLRDEWGHSGLIISDWFGTYSTAESIEAGVDIEMPVPTAWRSQYAVMHSMAAHKIEPESLDTTAREILRWIQIIHDNRTSTRNRSVEREQEYLRQVAQEGIVLLKNEGILPLKY